MALGDAHYVGLRDRLAAGHELSPVELQALALLLIARHLASLGRSPTDVRILRVAALRLIFPDFEDPGADPQLGDPL